MIAIQPFIDYIRFEKRYSNHTIIAYENDLKQFLAYLSAAYNITEVKEVNHLIIRSWIVQLMEQGITARAVNRKITTLKTWYKFLLRQSLVIENPMQKIQSPKTSKRLPVFIEQQKMDTLLDSIEFGEGFNGVRIKMILELFYATGMRLSELISLKETDVNFYNNTLKVLGKRNKERLIPFNDKLKGILQDYMAQKQQAGLSATVLLVTDKDEPFQPRTIWKLVNENLSKVTTLDKKSPHVLRHTFATHMLNNGADLNAVKELLGHANLSATQIYTHNTIEKLKESYRKAHPRAS